MQGTQKIGSQDQSQQHPQLCRIKCPPWPSFHWRSRACSTEQEESHTARGLKHSAPVPGQTLQAPWRVTGISLHWEGEETGDGCPKVSTDGSSSKMVILPSSSLFRLESSGWCCLHLAWVFPSQLAVSFPIPHPGPAPSDQTHLWACDFWGPI